MWLRSGSGDGLMPLGAHAATLRGAGGDVVVPPEYLTSASADGFTAVDLTLPSNTNVAVGVTLLDCGGRAANSPYDVELGGVGWDIAVSQASVSNYVRLSAYVWLNPATGSQTFSWSHTDTAYETLTALLAFEVPEIDAPSSFTDSDTSSGSEPVPLSCSADAGGLIISAAAARGMDGSGWSANGTQIEVEDLVGTSSGYGTRFAIGWAAGDGSVQDVGWSSFANTNTEIGIACSLV